MAGDWMKIETTTPDKPEVVKIAALLGIDQDTVTGKLLRLWAWADANCVDGRAVDITAAFLDRLTHCPGFSGALAAVGWLLPDEGGGFTFPNFHRHNGTTAKARADANRRMTKLRSKRHGGDASVTENASLKASPEKRREEDGNSSGSDNDPTGTASGDPPVTYDIPRSPGADPGADPGPDPAALTPADIARYGRSLPMAFPPEAAAAFHDTMQATGWTSKHGQPIRDWRAAFRRYLSVWNHREQHHRHPPPPSANPQGRGVIPASSRRPPAPATLEPMEWEK